MTKYRKHPLIIEAVQWTGDNTPEVQEFLGDRFMGQSYPHHYLVFRSIEGAFKASHRVSPGDYIVRGIDGEFYPVKPSIFEMTYEKLTPVQD